MTDQYDLLDKSELRVTDVELVGADLTALATVVARTLGFEDNEVLVTDYLDSTLTFDVLRPTVYAHQLSGRGVELLDALRGSAGVTLSAQSRVTSNGMLGWIAADAADMSAALADAHRLAAQIDARIAKRVAVFSTGGEVIRGEIKDTNWAAISQRLDTVGFRCQHLGALRDDRELIAGAIRRAASEGFGVVITTGGVGAEAKDCTVEAVLDLIPAAITRYTCHFTVGHGRHVKDGVRIAVGTFQGCRVIALPGPNDEVIASLPLVEAGLLEGLSDEALSLRIAETLRGLLRTRMEPRSHP
jgi:molybdenum cofactor synthesis domain-containing protein